MRGALATVVGVNAALWGMGAAALAQPDTDPSSSSTDATEAGQGGDGEAAAPVPATPTGRLIELGTRPSAGPRDLRACSFVVPICVHAAPGVGDPGAVLEALASVERAWGPLTGALALPSPDIDVGTGALDVFLVDRVEGLADAVLERRDARSAFDRASAFIALDAHARGCDRDAGLARALARASLWRAAPATDEASARAETSYVARLLVPCAMGLVDGADRFQQSPERAIPDSTLGIEREDGAALFYWWLDYTFGTEPGSTIRALWALAPTRTPAGAPRWQGKPNGVDVLRASFRDALSSGSTVDDLWVEFGVNRALVGDADDGRALPEARSLGAAGRVRADWNIPWPERARSLASGVGVAPTGTAYVGISHAGAAPGAGLRIEAAWEEHAKMRWSVVKIGPSGNQLGHLPVPGPDRGTSAQITVVDLQGVSRILLVGTNVGDPSYPLDPGPSDGVWEPHGWTVTVAAQ